MIVKINNRDGSYSQVQLTTQDRLPERLDLVYLSFAEYKKVNVKKIESQKRKKYKGGSF